MTGNLAAGEGLDELLFAALRIASGHGDHSDSLVASSADGIDQCIDGVGLVVFNPDQATLGIQRMQHDLHAIEDVVRAFAHQGLIAGNVRLALGAIDDQRVDDTRPGVELDKAGECRATQAHHARLTNTIARCGGIHRQPVGGCVGLLRVLPVWLDHDAGRRQPRRMGDRAGLNGHDRAGGRRMNRGGHIALGCGQRLATQDVLSDAHQTFGRLADVLG